MPVNKVIGLLNPKIMEDRNGKGEISLSVDHPDKIMEMGDAIDCGKCGAKRADGSGCTNVVNTNTCEFCTFHVQKAYKNMSSKRPDLQSSFSGGAGARSRIMSKIDPKGKIFSLHFQKVAKKFETGISQILCRLPLKKYATFPISSKRPK